MGRVAALWEAAWLAWVRHRREKPAGARFIAPGADEVKRIMTKHPFIKQIPRCPPAATRVRRRPVATIGSWAFVLARPTLDDDVAYRLVRALDKGAAAIGKRLQQARESTMANTVAAAPRVDLIHPGLCATMREIGLCR
jgi:TRAP-type uncharacterized transport system substrate-binding protein